MTFDITLSGNVAYGTGVFGKSLSAGTGVITGGVLAGTSDLTMSVRFKTTATAMQCIAGIPGVVWFGTNAEGKAIASIFNAGTYSDDVMVSSVTVNDDAYHHMELTIATGALASKLFIDGVQMAAITTNLHPNRGQDFGVRFLLNNGFNFSGDIDELAIYSNVQHTTSFSPSTQSVPNASSNLIAVYHFDNNGVNSMGADPTPPVFTTVPIIVGTPTVASATGFTTGNVTTNDPPNMTQQWVISSTVNGTVTNIDGATDTTYTPVIGDAGKFIGVVQKATNTAAPNGVTSTSVLKQVVSNVAVNPRTVKGVLRLDEETLAANLTGLRVCVSTGTGPDNRGNVLYQSNTLTTNVLGEYNIAFDSTEIAVGGQAWFTLLGPNGVNVASMVGVTA